jgi:hypothetical protein
LQRQGMGMAGPAAKAPEQAPEKVPEKAEAKPTK